MILSGLSCCVYLYVYLKLLGLTFPELGGQSPRLTFLDLWTCFVAGTSQLLFRPSKIIDIHGIFMVNYCQRFSVLDLFIHFGAKHFGLIIRVPWVPSVGPLNGI